jgi:hypothetical protein
MRDVEGNVLATYALTFSLGAAAGTPYVVSTVPEAGATVDTNLNELVFVFSEPMSRIEGGTTGGWWPYTTQWSADMKTMRVIRTGSAGLPPGASIFFRLPTFAYRSAAGVRWRPSLNSPLRLA